MTNSKQLKHFLSKQFYNINKHLNNLNNNNNNTIIDSDFFQSLYPVKLCIFGLEKSIFKENSNENSFPTSFDDDYEDDENNGYWSNRNSLSPYLMNNNSELFDQKISKDLENCINEKKCFVFIVP
eukprot:c13049_g1_i3.p1 GENE.c13049_g1_i3~~c13049_g1_i3.p1  ORF type:complete len:132 (+),score=27.32 c13049_g1_i3:24-398(+)